MTTAIPYTNSSPHIGHIYENILADFLARYHRQKEEEVIFQTGTDEHGQKNYLAAKKSGISTKMFVDQNTKKFVNAFKVILSSHDNFIRTISKKNHWPGAQELWRRIAKKGDLYKKSYRAEYCVGCERFVTSKDLRDGECCFHPGKKLKILKEENYFFRLSRYTKQLIELIESDKYRLKPTSAKNEILSFLKGDVQDISFSREKTRLPWGIPVPGDDNQVIYVWGDALSNYITGIGFNKNMKHFNKWWPADVHVIGRDISRFHAIYWPAMLISAGIKTPKELWVHGFINDKNGVKMSKSLGNVIDPLEQVDKYSISSVRYYLLRALPCNQDGGYSEENLIARYNSDLANNLGNLLNRSLNLIQKNGGKVPVGKYDMKLKKKLDATLKRVDQYISNFEFHIAVSEIWRFISEVNQYVDSTKPWTLSGKNLDAVLYNLAESLKLISAMVFPIIPTKAEEIAKQLGLKTVPKLKDGPIKSGTKIKKGRYLFTKIQSA